MFLAPEHERVRTLLVDTVTLLCKNGLNYKSQFSITGVLGITLDNNEVFLVEIKDTVKTQCEDVSKDSDNSSDESAASTESNNHARQKCKRKSKKRKAKTSEADNFSIAPVKSECPDVSESLNISSDDDIQIKEERIEGETVQPALCFQYGNCPPVSTFNLQPTQSIVNASWAGPQQKAMKTSFTCSICGKMTSTSVGLKYHMNKHKGIFPYYCPYCNKGISGTTDLKAHLATQHTNGVMAYLCVYCRETLPAVQGLKQHLQTCPANTGREGKEAG